MTDRLADMPRERNSREYLGPLLKVILLLGALSVAFWLGSRFAPKRGSTDASAGSVPRQKESWTCSMHPQIRLEGAGSCPICEMPLIPAGGGQTGGDGAPMLTLSEHAMAMASVETAPVIRQKISHRVRAVGKIQYNETALATVTVRFDGYAEKLFVNFTGIDIKAGQHLADVYSPDLLVAQQELLSVLDAGGGRSLEPTKGKLRRWGLTDAQINDLAQSRSITDRVTLYSPIDGTVIEKNIVENSAFKAGDALYRVANLDTVWAYVDIYEFDLAWIRYGQQVELTAEAYPGRVFTGMVTFVQPVLNEETRTIRVPVHIENKDHSLKPGMFVSTVIDAVLAADGRPAPTGVEGKYTCPMHPQVLHDGAGSCPFCGMPLEKIPEPPIPPANAAPAPTGPQFYCPMKCEDEKTYNEPGRCPVCEMKLVPVETAAPHYFCPMKCEGDKTYDQPGNCPVCGMRLDEVPADAGPAGGLVVVPASAVLDSGTRRIVYVEKGGGTFEPREVAVGPRSDDVIPILKGLTLGERVVTRGGFLIDSQFQVTGQPSLYYPGGLHASMGHEHGAGEGMTEQPQTPAKQEAPMPSQHKH